MANSLADHNRRMTYNHPRSIAARTEHIPGPVEKLLAKHYGEMSELSGKQRDQAMALHAKQASAGDRRLLSDAVLKGHAQAMGELVQRHSSERADLTEKHAKEMRTTLAQHGPPP
jgi:hypothetical protein